MMPTDPIPTSVIIAYREATSRAMAFLKSLTLDTAHAEHELDDTIFALRNAIEFASQSVPASIQDLATAQGVTPLADSSTLAMDVEPDFMDAPARAVPIDIMGQLGKMATAPTLHPQDWRVLTQVIVSAIQPAPCSAGDAGIREALQTLADDIHVECAARANMNVWTVPTLTIYCWHARLEAALAAPSPVLKEKP
jgi:hypothetical protein